MEPNQKKELETEHIYTRENTDAIFKTVAFILVLASIFAAVLVAIFSKDLSVKDPFSKVKKAATLSQFSSNEEFRDYVRTAQESSYYAFGRGSVGMENFAADKAAPLTSPTVGLGAAPDRVSTTNVQVKGIDEPDIVKTDGTNIFLSRQGQYYPLRGIPSPLILEDRIMPTQIDQETSIISALPPETMDKIGEIDKSGELLLSGKTLLVLSNEKIRGYDISNIKEPKSDWDVDIEGNNYLVTARLMDGTVYAVFKNYVTYTTPCPIPFMKRGGELIQIACTDIYHPNVESPSDTTYTVVSIDPQSGSIKNKITILAQEGQSIVYMSKSAVYLTYTYSANMPDMMYQFFVTEGSGVLPAEIVDRIEKLREYDISNQSKLQEIELLIQKHLSTLSNDDRLTLEQEMQNKLSSYVKSHVREIENTGIAKISIPDLNARATGTVPGHPLNQFSLDEYKDNVRIATTINGGFWGANVESVNDIYILDAALRELGSLKDLGKEERIYSVRFIGDLGYMVTFKQVDPFFVLDLSRPDKPRVSGELKIPGYSSYLHPLTDTLILGVGKEDQYVKLSLFDVSNPNNPREVSKYTTDEYWSEALNNHHAFLQDDKHKIVFIPGNKGGYIFSYNGNALTLKTAVANVNALRALFINDYLYVISQDQIVVLNETSWERVKDFSL